MKKLLVFLIACAVTVGLNGSVASRAYAQTADIPLAWSMPEGVTFATVATGAGATDPEHIDAMALQQIDIRCGEVSGEIAGIEQITFVEYGAVDIRDWETGVVLDTLTAGQAFGPSVDATSFFLAGRPGQRALVYHFGIGRSANVGDELPASLPEDLDCGTGAAAAGAKPATVTSIFAYEGNPDAVPGANPVLTGPDLTFYVGLLTVEPGAAIGRAGTEAADNTPYTATGSGVIVPVVGGFGSGSEGMAGMTAGPEAAPNRVAWMQPAGDVALENAGSFPTIALVFGVVHTGQPVLYGHHTD